MKIEKIKIYNQKLLAVLGTTVALIAIIGFIFISYFAISDIINDIRYQRNETGLLSEKKVEELQEENLRQQVISYELPQLIDTLNLIYIIPVTHKTLNNPEEIGIDEGVLSLLDIQSGVKSRGKHYSSRIYGSFNNLLVYDKKNEKVKRLFNNRVNFEKIESRYLEDDILISFMAAESDTNNDGIINLIDLKSLLVYSLKEKQLKKISLPKTNVLDYTFVENSKDLLVRFGVDHNNNGKFNGNNEPEILKRYEFKKGVLVNIVDKNLHQELQKTLEGSNIPKAQS